MKNAITMFAILIQTNSQPVELPEKAREVLDVVLTSRWHTSERDIHICNLNGDELVDYVMKATVGEGSCLVVYYIALIGMPDGFVLHLLGADPAHLALQGRQRFVVRRTGETVTDFSAHHEGEPREISLETDAIEFIPVDGCCATVFIYSEGGFRLFTSSD